jgi:hypothetical protein
MKILTSLQQSQISGGSIITLDGTKYYVNTIGIPQNCVNLFESMYDAGITASNKSNSSRESINNAMDKCLDPLIEAGCLMYSVTFSVNLDYRIKMG